MPKKVIHENGLVRAAGVLLLTQTPQPKFLLMRHAAGWDLPAGRRDLPKGRWDLPKGRWDLPKGHCDGEETYLETAMRELHEETGISPAACRFDESFQFDVAYEVSYRKQPGRIFQKNVRYFLARLPEIVKIEVTEHESYQWWDWSPPHQIQTQTIDPLLAAVAVHLAEQHRSTTKNP